MWTLLALSALAAPVTFQVNDALVKDRPVAELPPQAANRHRRRTRDVPRMPVVALGGGDAGHAADSPSLNPPGSGAVTRRLGSAQANSKGEEGMACTGP